MIAPFILVTSLFALWGFANDVTNPLVKAFKDIFVISNAQSSLVQTAFYGGYATMAIPAALFIFKFSYKSGIIVGLSLYALGAFTAIPAAVLRDFNLFLVALYVLTFGLAFLETTANPYVLSMGCPETATQRLNFAQAFNPMGSLVGMVVASSFILSNLQVEKIREDLGAFRAGREAAAAVEPVLATYLTRHPDASFDELMAAYKEGEIAEHAGRSFDEMQRHDLSIVRTPYVALGAVVVAMIVVFLCVRMPGSRQNDDTHTFRAAWGRIARNSVYVGGVLAQAAYVGAQIMCWTFIIHYATHNLGVSAATAQNYNILAMVIFCVSRFICTFLLRYTTPTRLLFTLAVAGVASVVGVIFLRGDLGLWCLIATSGCMSLMFPTIYGIALDGMAGEAKLASAGLIFAILGGALMPPLQGAIIDMGGSDGFLFGMPSVNVSFVLPLVCFVIIAGYALYAGVARRARAFASATA